ncbi:hypothetical protein QE152_g27723 [Popillia japonica]|uniref:Uncharacterized protein n=1 Tax=Popillia japonica TaxID=7064 RepID=A0AAW1JTD7_POPJA
MTVLQIVTNIECWSVLFCVDELAAEMSTAGTILKRAKFKPYCERASQGLQNGDEIRRAQFCQWFIEKHNENPNQGLQNGDEIRRAQFCQWFIEKHNENPNENVEELRQAVEEAVNGMTPNMVRQSCEAVLTRCRLCIRMNGGLFEQLLH